MDRRESQFLAVYGALQLGIYFSILLRYVLQFVQHAEGRITMTGSEPVYEYFLKDHLGNVRVTFTTQKETETSRASMEIDRRNTERSQFIDYDKMKLVHSPIANKRVDDYGSADGFAVLLRGGANERIGLAKEVQVMPGEKVHIEVYAKYINRNQQNYGGYFFQQLVTALASGTAGPLVVDGPSSGSSGTPPPGVDWLNPSDDTGPQAYLRYVFVPKDFDFTQKLTAQVRLSENAQQHGDNGEHEKLELDFEATKAGYLYIYFCNDREVPVTNSFLQRRQRSKPRSK